MPTNSKTSSRIGKMLEWLSQLGRAGVQVDEYELFRQVVAADSTVKRRVSSALEAAGAPSFAQLTRERFYALTEQQRDAALAALLATLGMGVEQARAIFCVQLNWCERRRGWKRLLGKLLQKVPSKWRNTAAVAGSAAPWVWDAIQILMNLNPSVQWTVFAGKLAAYLAMGELDRLCGCRS